MPEKRAYITLLGRSAWAVLNTYYAVLVEKSYYPDTIHIFAEKSYAEDLDSIIEGMRALSEEFEFKPEISSTIIEDNDFITAVEKIGEMVKELKKQGCSVAIDITPGRKPLVSAALIPAVKLRLEHIFYLAVKKLEPKPYMMIPIANQQLRDFMEEAARVRE
ncbi:hypothetical protein [Archaeoglobus sp.]|uniref:hypothetical protein n=1 Tax=Archaeoglobus sp. TaxID=1872626 RepID=UPI0024AC3481|nr:hypothetical protein [Archaeoglobus sp.]MDI3498308.1 hypothetical protein [Archaeoglobus sp.]